VDDFSNPGSSMT